MAFAVQSYEDAQSLRGWGYRHLSGEKGYEDIDIMALQTIWGESKSRKSWILMKAMACLCQGKEKLYSLTETIQTLRCSVGKLGFKYYNQWPQRMANKVLILVQTPLLGLSVLSFLTAHLHWTSILVILPVRLIGCTRQRLQERPIW